MSASTAAAQLLRQCGVDEPVEMAVLLGTGLGALAGALNGPVTVSYQDLPGFPEMTVPGHAGQLAIGVQEGVRVAYLQGRAHFYENGDASVMARAGGIMHGSSFIERLDDDEFDRVIAQHDLAEDEARRAACDAHLSDVYAAYGEPLKSLSRPSFAKHPTPLPSEYVRSLLV
jgi:hypothetical protein